MKHITPADLIPLDLAKAALTPRIELAYAQDDNLLFGERIYRKDAKLIAHKDMAAIIIKATQLAYESFDLRLVVYDCLRTVDAQKAMLQTQRVRDNPHWLEEPRLLSPPGAGAHPRGMAVDVSLESLDGVLLDMGTPFDFLAESSAADKNPAHRNYPRLSDGVIVNRGMLDEVMFGAAEALNMPLNGLPQEWWDYRFPSDVYEQYAPLADGDLPADMRMT